MAEYIQRKVGMDLDEYIRMLIVAQLEDVK